MAAETARSATASPVPDPELVRALAEWLRGLVPLLLAAAAALDTERDPLLSRIGAEAPPPGLRFVPPVALRGLARLASGRAHAEVAAYAQARRVDGVALERELAAFEAALSGLLPGLSFGVP